MKRRAFHMLAGALALALGQPVAAQEEDDASSDAETTALLAYLGLSAASGTTSVNEGAGSSEAYLLTTILLDRAAGEMLGHFTDGRRYLVVAEKDKVDLSVHSRVEARLGRLLDAALTFARSDENVRACRDGVSGNAKGLMELGEMNLEENGAKAAATELTAADIFGAVRVSTDISPIAVDLDTSLLVTALTKRAAAARTSEPADLRVWTEIANSPQPSALASKLAAVENEIAALEAAGCKEVLPKEQFAEFTADLAKIKAAAASFRKPASDGALSPIEAADRVAGALGDRGNEARILRLSVDKAGGTLLNNSSIWTSLGIPGTTVRAALVVFYRSIVPDTGQIEKAGIIACNFPVRLLKHVTSAKITALKELGHCDHLI
ncbi:hypothetical protein [Erythrobacter sp.]|jgi:hypothetical protein|uniref:hypothetical protein n=1 Tax=Erythrobacter sp. TaxID=1042 RepID=UPI002ECBB970|nr:hypothetical protein [Erythrobacter sp.]